MRMPPRCAKEKKKCRTIPNPNVAQPRDQGTAQPKYCYLAPKSTRFPATETSTKCLQIRYLQSAVSSDEFPQHGATPTPRSNATSAGWKKEGVERHSPPSPSLRKKQPVTDADMLVSSLYAPALCLCQKSLIMLKKMRA